MNKYFSSLWEIAKGFSFQVYKGHQIYFQTQLRPFFAREDMPLNKRIYEKPLGYSGDYMVMDYLYGKYGYSGNRIYGKLLDRYIVSSPIAIAVVNRKEYSKNLILSAIKDNKCFRELRISNFACGSAREVLDILNKDIPLENVIFTCVDAELLALQQIKKELMTIQKNTAKKFNIQLIHENILYFIRRDIKPKRLQNQDIIYCGGLLDYLSAKTSIKLIEYLFSLLRDNGILVMSNISKENPFRVGLEMLYEWYLYHRDSDELFSFASGIKEAKHISVKFDSATKMFLYLIIKR